MRGLGAGVATGDGAGRISVAIAAECTGRSLAPDPLTRVGGPPTVPVRRRHHGAGYHSTDARLPSRAPSMSRPPLRVAVLGAGTVGGAVLDRLLHHADRLVT